MEARMRVFVRCHTNGTILSVAKVHTMADELPHPFGDVSDAERVIEIDATDKVAQLDPHEIVERYTVDPASATVRRRSPSDERDSAVRPAARPKKSKSK
jgi:hypothetical protein